VRHIVLVTTIAAVMLVSPLRAQSGYQLLQQGLSKEQAQGNLKEAIAIYQRIVKDFAADHALAAQALLHLGECYQKLGDVQAQQTFERIVREYPDQRTVAAAARARLSSPLASSQPKGDRPVWSGGFVDGFGTISPDGRFLTYTDWPGSAGLMLHDLVTGSDRRLTPEPGKDGATQYSTISPDGRQVAFESKNAAGRYELRALALDGTGGHDSRRVLDLEDAQEIAPLNWSPDDRSIAVEVVRGDQTVQIGLVRVADGSLRVLKSARWKGPIRIAFSPDGQYVAYDLIVEDRPLERHVFVTAIDGSHDATVVDDHSGNAVMGWSPDGGHLLFSSDRSGSIDLWAIPIAAGRSTGHPFLVKPNIGTFWSNGISASGTMYVWKKASPIYVQVASIDLEAGRLTQPPNPADRVFIASRGRPAWSADGRQLAYESCDPLGGGPCRLFVRSIDTGRTRAIDTPLQYLFFPHFSADGRWLVARANDGKGHAGIYRIDVDSGESVLITSNGANPQRAGRGNTFAFERRTGTTVTLLEQSVVSGEPQRLLEMPASSGGTISPDHQSVAIVTQSPRDTTLSVMPVSGGQLTTLLRVTGPAHLYGYDPRHVEWAPDSRSVLVVKTLGDESDSKELWLVPIDGRTPRKLDIDVTRWTLDGGFHLSPDGKQIVFVAATGRPGEEIWALENFLPATGRNRTKQTPASAKR